MQQLEMHLNQMAKLIEYVFRHCKKSNCKSSKRCEDIFRLYSQINNFVLPSFTDVGFCYKYPKWYSWKRARSCDVRRQILVQWPFVRYLFKSMLLWERTNKELEANVYPGGCIFYSCFINLRHSSYLKLHLLKVSTIYFLTHEEWNVDLKMVIDKIIKVYSSFCKI